MAPRRSRPSQPPSLLPMPSRCCCRYWRHAAAAPHFRPKPVDVELAVVGAVASQPTTALRCLALPRPQACCGRRCSCTCGDCGPPPPARRPPAGSTTAHRRTGEHPAAVYAPTCREVDDNADFTGYLAYLRNSGGVRAHTVDVSERYVITVLNDNQQPVLDARVRIFDGQAQVFMGRTYAGGKTIFQPQALGISPNVQSLRVQIEKGNRVAEGSLLRGQSDTPSFVLQPQRCRVRCDSIVLFLLDATGKMGDEIAQIQQTIVSIAERSIACSRAPSCALRWCRIATAATALVTRVHDFTADVAAFRELLPATSAGGGGDEPGR
ncbi:MAG: hypothetical protein U0Z44_07435 [Kouleothrix sp.]